MHGGNEQPRAEVTDGSLLLISEDAGNARALQRAEDRLTAGYAVHWVCSTTSSAGLNELEAIAELKNSNMAQLNLLVITREEAQPFDVLTGQLDRSKLEQIFAAWLEPAMITECLVAASPQRTVQLEGFLNAALPNLRHAVHSLTDSEPGGNSQQVEPGDADQPRQVSVTVIQQGRERRFSMKKGDGTLLDGADDAEMDLPFSCRGGVCSTCRAKLVQGEVELLENYALEDWELEAGFTLPCQAEPLSSTITLDYDTV